MKRCPSCQRTYEDDTQVFCFTDGTRLVEEGQAYDSQRTLVAPPPPPQAQPEQPPQYYPQDRQSGPSSYSTQANQPPSWPPSSGQSGQQAWLAQQPATPPAQPPWATPQPPSPHGAPFPSTAAQSDEGKRTGLSIASLVLGILSIQNGLFIALRFTYAFGGFRIATFLLAFIGVILGAIALTLSTTNSARHAGRGFAIVGIITSILGVFFMMVRL